MNFTNNKGIYEDFPETKFQDNRSPHSHHSHRSNWYLPSEGVLALCGVIHISMSCGNF